jgi:hypothetical protein
MAKAANVILVHGAWADGSCWSKVIPLLESRALRVSAVQLPLTWPVDSSSRSPAIFVSLRMAIT